MGERDEKGRVLQVPDRGQRQGRVVVQFTSARERLFIFLFVLFILFILFIPFILLFFLCCYVFVLMVTYRSRDISGRG